MDPSSEFNDQTNINPDAYLNSLDDFKYEVLDEDIDEFENDDDDIADVLASIQQKQISVYSDEPTSSRSGFDDNIKYMFQRLGFSETLEVFKKEYKELRSKKLITDMMIVEAASSFISNEEIEMQIHQLSEQINNLKLLAEKARKERDTHRLNYKRIVYDKNKLLDDLRRLRHHITLYEPTIEELKKKYEVIMREKSLMRIERDKLRQRNKQLEDQVTSLQPQTTTNTTTTNTENSSTTSSTNNNETRSATRKVNNEAIFPSEGSLTNPYLNPMIPINPIPIHTYQSKLQYSPHESSISYITCHPKKSLFVTASHEDNTWKLWNSTGKVMITGEGHTHGITGIHFHPYGNHLVTSSNDNTIKLWEINSAKCSTTFTDHTQPVLGCEFHMGGDFIASCSMDHNICIWDIISSRNRAVLTGHSDSVTAISWIPYTNNLVSVSSDTTVSMWDARLGECIQTLHGHNNVCTHVKVMNTGNYIVSSDKSGIVKLWDTRMTTEIQSIDLGPSAINQLAIDQGGHTILAASDDGTIKCIYTHTFSLLNTILTPTAPVSTNSIERFMNKGMRSLNATTTAATSSSSSNMTTMPSIVNKNATYDGKSNANTSSGNTGVSSSSLSPIRCIALSANVKMLLSGSMDHKVTLWSSNSTTAIVPT